MADCGWFEWGILGCVRRRAGIIFIETSKLKNMLMDLRRRARTGEFNMEDPETRLAAWGGYVTSEGVDILSESMVSDEVFSESCADGRR
jgi:hypothetical protein